MPKLFSWKLKNKMSIAERSGQGESITEGWRAFDLFTNRYELIRIFTNYLNDEPAQERILFFYGEGGNGKSLLLKFLQEHCCKYVDARNWEWIKSKPEEEFIERLKNLRGAEAVQFALIDFNPSPAAGDSAQDAFSALLTLRRALAHPNLQFPLFDFACAWYLSNRGMLTEEQRQYLLLSEGTKFIAKLIDVISHNIYGAVATAVLSVFNTDLRNWFILSTRRRKLDAESIKEIQRLAPRSRLLSHLPVFFAEDLSTAMLINGSPKRVVIFLDAHEAFWGIERKLSEELFFQRDEWVRKLLVHLELSRGIVVLVAGREPPRWPEASKQGTIISDKFIDLQHVGPLSEEHALRYLQRAGIDNLNMRQCLATYAEVRPRQVHPLYLGLCTDVLLAAKEKNQTLTPEEFQRTEDTTEQAAELIRRLLRYVDDDIAYPVRALSACRSFDRELYFRLGDALRLGVTEQSFDALVRFSFVWRAAGRGKGWYRIHDTLRRIFHAQDDEITRRADKFLNDYYSVRGDNVALAESAYHSNRLAGENDIEGWLLCFHAGMTLGQHELCRLLIEVRSEMTINRGMDIGRVLRQEADYFEGIAKYEEAEQSYLAAIAAFDEALIDDPRSLDAFDRKAFALLGLGEIQARLSRHLEAYNNYRKAVAHYNRILKYVPDHPSTTNRAIVLVAIGELLHVRSKTKTAIKVYEKAIAIFEKDLQRWPRDADAHDHLGSAHVSVGNLQFELSLYDEAIESFNKAISGCDKAIKQLPVVFRFHHNKGNALTDLGEVQVRLKQYEEAQKCFVSAAGCFDEALRYSRDSSMSWDGRGVALRHLGDVQIERSLYDDSKESYKEAIASFNEALRLTPGSISAQFNKAHALQSLGVLEYESTDQEKWIGLFHEAIALVDELLERAPDFIFAYNNKGIALLTFGQLHIKQARYRDAERITRMAIGCFDEAISRSPGYIFAHNNRGRALRNLALCCYFLGDYASATQASQAAAVEFSWSTETAPRDKRIHHEKAGISDFLTIFGSDLLPGYKPSIESDPVSRDERFVDLIEAVGGNRALLDFNASDNVERDFQTLLQLLSKSEARNNLDGFFELLSKQYDAAIKINSDNPLVLCHWGSLCHQWAMIKSDDEADQLFALACEKYERALRHENMHTVLNDWGVVLCDWASTKSGEEADDLFNLSCQKHEASLKIKPTKHEAYLNWGKALCAQALNKRGIDPELLLAQACEKYEAGLRIKPDDFMLQHNLGIAFRQRAFSASGKEASRFFALACEKFESVLRARPTDSNSMESLQLTLSRWGDVISRGKRTQTHDDLNKMYGLIFEHFEMTLHIKPAQADVLFFWGNALLAQAELANGPDAERTLTLANEKFESALRVQPDLSYALINSGTTLLELAKIRSDQSGAEGDRLFNAACEKYEKAFALKPEISESIINWGAALAEKAKRKSGDEASKLWLLAYEKFASVAHRTADEHRATAFYSWGTALMQQAVQNWKPGDSISSEAAHLLGDAITTFDTAHQINPDEGEYLVIWGRVLELQAVHMSGRQATDLYAQAFEKFSKALGLKSVDIADIEDSRVNCLSHWAAELCDWAKGEQEKRATKLLFRACEKLEQANRIAPTNAKVLRDWGKALFEVAEMKKGEKYVHRLNLAQQKLEASLSLLPDDVQTQLWWSRTMRAIARTQMTDEQKELLDSFLESIRESGYEV